MTLPVLAGHGGPVTLDPLYIVQEQASVNLQHALPRLRTPATGRLDPQRTL
jgi:hypothetical protein